MYRTGSGSSVRSLAPAIGHAGLTRDRGRPRSGVGPVGMLPLGLVLLPGALLVRAARGWPNLPGTAARLSS